MTRHKQEDGGDLLIFGHGRLGETLLRAQLTDVIDLSVYPVLAGSGKQFFRDGQAAKVRLAATWTSPGSNLRLSRCPASAKTPPSSAALPTTSWPSRRCWTNYPDRSSW